MRASLFSGSTGFAEEHRLSFGRGQEAGQHLHGRRLAAAVGAEEAEDLAALDREVHRVDGRELSEPAREVLGHDGRLGVGLDARRDGQTPPRAAFLLGQQGHEGLFQVLGSRPLLELFRGARGQNPPGIHRDQPVEAIGFIHVGRRDEHAHPRPAGADVVDERPELLTRERVDARRGLVENEQVRVVNQRRAEPDLLLHAPRQLPGRPVRERVEPGRLQEPVDPRATLRAGEPEQLCEEVDVLEDAQLEVQVLAEPLRHVGDERADGVAVPAVRDVAAQHLDLPGLDLLRAGDDPHEGRLTDAVGADQADHTTGRDLGRHRIERARLPVAVCEVGDARDGFGQGWHRDTRGQGLGGKCRSRKAGQATVSSSRT